MSLGAACNHLQRVWRRGSLLGRDPEDRKESSVSLVSKKGKEDLRNYRLLSHTSIPGKVLEQQILETISRHCTGQEGDCK